MTHIVNAIQIDPMSHSCPIIKADAPLFDAAVVLAAGDNEDVWPAAVGVEAVAFVV